MSHTYTLYVERLKLLFLHDLKYAVVVDLIDINMGLILYVLDTSVSHYVKRNT